MAAKRKVVKKSSSKKPVKRQKAPVKTSQVMVSSKKVKRTTNSLIFSLITFVVSLVLFLVVEKESFLESLFGFIMIIAGAFVLLFIILEIIFYFMKRK